jgi:hypothetical protein
MPLRPSHYFSNFLAASRLLLPSAFRPDLSSDFWVNARLKADRAILNETFLNDMFGKMGALACTANWGDITARQYPCSSRAVA